MNFFSHNETWCGLRTRRLSLVKDSCERERNLKSCIKNSYCIIAASQSAVDNCESLAGNEMERLSTEMESERCDLNIDEKAR